MDSQDLISRIARGWARDRHVPIAERLRKGAELLSQSAAAQFAFRNCDSVGSAPRLTGRAVVANGGSIRIGSSFVVHGVFLPVELISGRAGSIEIGDGVWVNFGTVLAAGSRVKIGDRVMIGQHCIISDLEIPEAAADSDGRDARPVTIGNDVWLAGRVTVLPGVTIGDRASIAAGSVVDRDIPPDVLAGGNPARVLRSNAAGGGAAHEANGASNGAAAATPAAVAPAAAAAPKFSGTLVADFTIDELVDELLVADVYPAAAGSVAPFGQVAQVLLSPPADDAADFCVVWTRAESAVPSFARVLAHESVPETDLLAEVDAFAALVLGAAPNYKAIFVPTWTAPPGNRGLGMLDLRESGSARALLAMNLRLADALGRRDNVFVLDAARWWRAAPRAAASARGWYLGKMAVPRPVLAEAAADIRAALGGISGAARKLLVLDLDDTLWGGIVGDLGWENLRLGGHDAVGEAFVEFQRAVKALKQRGIVLALASKNEESVALEAIRSHPQMVLREDDFVGWRINWQDKARNIADLTTELNLGLQSVVFLDDNPVERARVREALPEVYVPDWPEDKLLYPSALAALRCFDSPRVSKEDLERTRMYAEERKRNDLQKQVGSIDDWLKSLEIKVKVEPLSANNLPRAAQLLNKTNQLNLTTRRLTEAELRDWAAGAKRALWTVSVSDRFGDAGLTGIVGLEHEGDTTKIVDYLLSCRVMGRKVEETMLHVAASWAGDRGATRLVAEYLPTKKNKPCLTAFKASGFANEDDRHFSWALAQAYPLPEPINLSWQR